MHRVVPVVIAGLLAAAVASEAGAQAAGFPSRSLRIVVPYAPGGIADLLSRVIAQRLGAVYSRQVLVENRPGSGGHVGADVVAKAPPDGYTLALGTIAHNAAYAMYANLPYDPAKDLVPVVLVAESAGVLVVHPSLPVKSVREFLALARARPGELNYGSAGHGSALHMAGELFKHVAKVNLTHVAYRGSAPAMVDLMGGQIQVIFENIPSAQPYIKSGRIRPLGVTGPTRNAGLPDVPPIAESGVPGYSAVPYYTFSTSAKVPADIVRRLNGDLSEAILHPELASRWAELGVTPLGGTQEAALQRNVVETARWSAVIRAAGIKAD
jgi:tripartite-type tricarboxylate transporter receptor subunit TctC